MEGMGQRVAEWAVKIADQQPLFALRPLVPLLTLVDTATSRSMLGVEWSGKRYGAVVVMRCDG